MAVYYVTPADIKEAIGGTDGGTGTCADLSDSQLTAAIGRASARVSAYTGTTYEPTDAQPAVTVPPLVENLTLQIAIYYATCTYRKNVPLDPQDPVSLEYADALRVLRDISTGDIQVIAPDPGAAPSVRARVINTLPRTFCPSDAGVVYDGRGGIVADTGPGTLLRDGWA